MCTTLIAYLKRRVQVCSYHGDWPSLFECPPMAFAKQDSHTGLEWKVHHPLTAVTSDSQSECSFFYVDEARTTKKTIFNWTTLNIIIHLFKRKCLINMLQFCYNCVTIVLQKWLDKENNWGEASSEVLPHSCTHFWTASWIVRQVQK